MPRLAQVSRQDVTNEKVLAAYTKHFGDRDPVSEPGTTSGTPGNWWTVFALDPGLFEVMLARQAWQFSEERTLDPVLRELACARVGWRVGSNFVFSQHCKLLRRLGLSRDLVAAVPSWSSADGFSPLQRAVLGYADDLAAGGRVADARFEALKAELDDVAILELTFITTTYIQSAIVAQALRLEMDDHDDLVVDAGAE